MTKPIDSAKVGQVTVYHNCEMHIHHVIYISRNIKNMISYACSYECTHTMLFCHG